METAISSSWDDFPNSALSIRPAENDRIILHYSGNLGEDWNKIWTQSYIENFINSSVFCEWAYNRWEEMYVIYTD